MRVEEGEEKTERVRVREVGAETREGGVLTSGLVAIKEKRKGKATVRFPLPAVQSLGVRSSVSRLLQRNASACVSTVGPGCGGGASSLGEGTQPRYSTSLLHFLPSPSRFPR